MDKLPEGCELEQFEALVNTGEDIEVAARQLLWILRNLDIHYGQLPASFHAHVPENLASDEINHRICTRLAGAITTLFSRKDFTISDGGFIQLMDYHRWLALIFAVSGYMHGDHIIRNINAAGGGCIEPITLNNSNLYLFCLCYYPDSEIPLQLDSLWNYNKKTVCRLFFALLSPRALPTPSGHDKKELLLDWLPSRLIELDSLEFLPVNVLHDVYMHCSYANLKNKHEIKRSINFLIRRDLLAKGFKDILPQPATPIRDVSLGGNKPVLLVVLEWFTSQHSVFRTHSKGFQALREHFTVYALALDNAVDLKSMEVFDIVKKISDTDGLEEIINLIDGIKPCILYYAGIGMFLYTIYLSNLRLAPLQLVGLGHAASTYCEQIDGFVIEEDFIGDESCFSERLIVKIPNDGLPFTFPLVEGEEYSPIRSPYIAGSTVKVAVCASIMKINPEFIDTLVEISKRSSVPVQFCFYLGFAKGLVYSYLVNYIRRILPTCEINPHLEMSEYRRLLGNCDFFLNPFPYGNMNGIMDCLYYLLPGVCLSGDEPHAHIDEGLFSRVGLSELVTRNKTDYINMGVRLAEEHNYREALHKKLKCSEEIEKLNVGDPQKYASIIRKLLE